MSRFSFATSSEINELKEKSKNENTKKATANWMSIYHNWAQVRGEEPNIECLSPENLDEVLQQFYAEIRKQDGKDYEPNSLAVMQAAIDRYLKESGYLFSILTSRQFSSSRAVLEGKARTLREKGMGKRPNKSCSLNTDEEETIWTSGQLGSHTPMSLINTLWWLFTQHFGMRGRQEHHDMKLEDFTFRKDEDGAEYVTYAEGITKTRQSGLHTKHRLSIPKMFESGTERCPVHFFKYYISKRPLELHNTGPFYLSVITNPATTVWYKTTPMGVNKINAIMKNMMKNSSLAVEKKITNHSARKTLVKKLKRNQVGKSEIISITGHNNKAGLDAYDSGGEKQQKAISNAIDNVPKPKSVLKNSYVNPTDPVLANPTFDFFPPRQQAGNYYNFSNCTVHINSSNPQQQNFSLSPPKKRYRRVILSSSDSSQD